jgi:hypothetical protein
MSNISAFDRAWRERLARELDRVAGGEIRERIMAGEGSLSIAAEPEAIHAWTDAMLGRMERLLSEADRKDALDACGCWMGKEDLRELRELYETTQDVDLVLEKAGEGLDRFLLDQAGVSQAVVDEVNRRGWGWPGRHAGDTIHVTKIPFEGTIEAFFAEQDPERRRALNYCHCPRVRDVLKEGKRLPATYCHCSAGFYKKNFEEIFGRPVDVEILQTVLSGDDLCAFAVHLPPGL